MPEMRSPYAETLGLIFARDSGRLVVTMKFADTLVGRPGFLHGGAISGLLENAGYATLLDALGEGGRIKPIGITVDFMRGGRPADTHAAATIVRLGRRVANVLATAWQEDAAKPIAQADLKLMIERA